MRIFLSYASEDRVIAEEIYLALVGAGHNVFFDRDSLRAAEEYHSRILEAIMAVDAMVFLISSSSVNDNSYTLTELKFARQKWTHPKARLLPVMVSKTDWDRIPSYLKAVTVLSPEGNVAAEAVAAVSSFSLERTGPGSAITKVSDNEIVYPGDIASTLNDVAAALKKSVGLLRSIRKSYLLRERFDMDFNRVELRVSLFERDSLNTGIVVQGSSDDVSNTGGRSATKRLIEMLTHLKTPGYRPDRLATSSRALVGIVCGFVLILTFILSFVLPPILSFVLPPILSSFLARLDSMTSVSLCCSLVSGRMTANANSFARRQVDKPPATSLFGSLPTQNPSKFINVNLRL